MSERTRFVLLALLGLALRLALWAPFKVVLAGDMMHNDAIVRNLIAGHGFSHSPAPPYYPDAQRSPAYIFFLLPLYLIPGPFPLVLVLAQSALDIAVAWLLWREASHVGRRVGWAAAALFLLMPYEAWFASSLLTETLSVFLSALWFVSLRMAWEDMTARRLSICSGAGAMAGLCRPALLAPVLLLGGVAVAARRRWKKALPAVAVMLVVLAPWTVRNDLAFDRPAPFNVGSAGATLWLGVVSDLDAHLTDEGGDAMRVFLRQWNTRSDVPPEVVLRADREMHDAAWRGIQAHPLGYAAHVVAQAGHLWWDPDDAILNRTTDLPESAVGALQALTLLGQRTLVLLAALGALARGRPWGIPSLAFIAALTLCYAVLHVEGRFMMAAEPHLAFLAALLLAEGQKGDR